MALVLLPLSATPAAPPEKWYFTLVTSNQTAFFAGVGILQVIDCTVELANGQYVTARCFFLSSADGSACAPVVCYLADQWWQVGCAKYQGQTVATRFWYGSGFVSHFENEGTCTVSELTSTSATLSYSQVPSFLCNGCTAGRSFSIQGTSVLRDPR